MKLYHGSNQDIQTIDLSCSKVGKDFGCGFYLSENKMQALELAERKTEQIGEGKPMVNEFDFDETMLTNGAYVIVLVRLTELELFSRSRCVDKIRGALTVLLH